MELKYEKIYAPGTDVGLKVTKGHFATNHAHTNYYIDLTTIKSRVSEAQEIARALEHMYLYDIVVDTIVHKRPFCHQPCSHQLLYRSDDHQEPRQ